MFPIPKTNYYETKDKEFTYITKRLFLAYHSEAEWIIFAQWMRGQTTGLVDGEAAIYSWDYERWVNQGKQTEQGSDWD